MPAPIPFLWMPAFLETLAKTGNVSEACRIAGINRTTAYSTRELHPGFKIDWEDALELATELLELEARRRALEGWENPVFYKGEECGRVKEYSDALTMFLLRAHKPLVYRDNVKHEHTGDVTIRVEYADEPDDPHDPAQAPDPMAEGGTP